MFGLSHGFDRFDQMFQRREPRGDDRHDVRLGDLFNLGGNFRDRMDAWFNRHTQDMPSTAMPGQPTPEPPADPVAQAAPQRRSVNPFMPISNQPVTFGSMLSRQPNYN